MKRVALTGGIAVGKTTLGGRLASTICDSCFMPENVSENIYLSDFYEDMKRWGFHSRVGALSMIASNYIDDDSKISIAIFDRCIDELITFAQLQFEAGNLSQKEFILYRSLYQEMVRLTPRLDLYVYCHCAPETSLQRIASRGRIFEQNISVDYIKDVNNQYAKWLATVPRNKLIMVDTDLDVNVGELADRIISKAF